MNQYHIKIHQRAMSQAKQHHESAAQLIRTLQDVERHKIHKQLGKRSLFQYATELLNFDEAIAYALISVARKTVEFPELQNAIESGKLSVYKAKRIVASLTKDNAGELIQFAQTHTKAEIENEVAKRNPKAVSFDRAKPLSDDLVEVKITISRATFAKLKRVESLEKQKNKPANWNVLLELTLEQYLEKNDPVRKAKRAVKKLSLRAAPTKLCPGTVLKPKDQTRIPLTAAQKHAVFARDGGRCTHVSADGKRCNQDHWLDVHHIVLVSQGGTNDPENLTTLCSFHHDLAHQLTLPLEDQITWLRSPRAPYGSAVN